MTPEERSATQREAIDLLLAQSLRSLRETETRRAAGPDYPVILDRWWGPVVVAAGLLLTGGVLGAGMVWLSRIVR